LIWQQQNFISKQTRQSLNFFSCALLDGVSCVPVCITVWFKTNVEEVLVMLVISNSDLSFCVVFKSELAGDT